MKSTSRIFKALLGGGLVLLLLFAIVSSQLLAQGDTWETKASKPTPIGGSVAGVIDGTFYVVGGNASGSSSNVVEAYDPTSDTWTIKAPIPTPRRFAAAGVINGKVYVMGGADNSPAINTLALEIYDPATDSWSTGTPMLGPARSGIAAGVIDDILYVVGGDNFGTWETILDAYDPVTNSWARKAPMPFGRRTLAAGVINGKLYVVGGLTACCTSQATLQVYDPMTNSWTVGTPLPEGRNQLVAGVIDDKLYAVTGVNQAGNGAANDTFEYNLTTDTWFTRSPIPTARIAASAGVINGKLYVVGGDLFGIGATAVLEVYTPPQTCVQPLPSMISWWDADSVSGATATDIQGSHDGTLVNGATTVPGRVGDAFSLFKKDDYVEVPSNPSLQFDPSTPFSIEGWINVGSYPATDTVPLVAKWGSKWPEFGYGLVVNVSKKIQFSLDQYGCCRNNVTGTSDITENTWYHFAATYDATTMRIYINGALEGSTRRSVNGTSASGSPLYIGNQIFLTAGDIFTVLIDELGIYSGALSASEIQAIYNAGSAGKCKGIQTVEDCSNGIDDDGDGFVDCLDPDCNNKDEDGDGFIAQPCGIDCDDNDSNNYPLTYYADTDGDGYGSTTSQTQACAPPVGYVTNNTDNCPLVSNPDQADADNDGIGDACDSCPNDPLNDVDGDGVCGDVDNCPLEDASGNDVNDDGCIDSVDDMPTLIESITLPQGVENSLLSTVNNAKKSLDKGNDKAAINQMKAFINNVNAQRGKKISDEEAQMLIDFAESAIDQI